MNGAFRAGLGAAFPFLSDPERRVASELDILEVTDEKHRPFLPLTFVLDSQLVTRGVWCGFWFWGNPTPDELRLALREITRAEQPSFDPVGLWAAGGAGPLGQGIDAPVVWSRGNSQGRELQRGIWEEKWIPPVGAEVSRSTVDGRFWAVVSVEKRSGRAAIHLRKKGEPAPDPHLVRHHLSAPSSTKVV